MILAELDEQRLVVKLFNDRADLPACEALPGKIRGWSKVKLAKELGMSENSVRRLLDLHHSSQIWVIDEALAKMNAELPIDLPKVRSTGKAA